MLLHGSDESMKCEPGNPLWRPTGHTNATQREKLLLGVFASGDLHCVISLQRLREQWVFFVVSRSLSLVLRDI